MKAEIVIGLGYGDEGKGLSTSYLCALKKKPLVVRFNGGHQAGHTVVDNGIRHVFSSFGAGTLQGAPTFIARFCTVFPTAIINEHDDLVSKGITPRLIIDPMAMVTTPYDLAHNQKIEDERGDARHGSVGVGYGATIKRNIDNYFLHMKDLYFPNVLRAKLDNISKYYDIELDCTDFLDHCNEILKVVEMTSLPTLLKETHDPEVPKSDQENYNLIFEGAQGLLLDQRIGFFPNVTRSLTDCTNAMHLIGECADYISKGNTEEITVDTYYITRTYLTRHGAGFLPNENPKLELKNNKNETNVSHDYQGDFRYAELNKEVFEYAITADLGFLNPSINNHLILTCMDQHPINMHKFMFDFAKDRFKTINISRGPSHDDITEFYNEKKGKYKTEGFTGHVNVESDLGGLDLNEADLILDRNTKALYGEDTIAEMSEDDDCAVEEFDDSIFGDL
jgi:adenylosuccinate synthase